MCIEKRDPRLVRGGQRRGSLGAGVDLALADEIFDRIDGIVPPGTDVTRLDQAYLPPPLLKPQSNRL